jgi:hypothetical protein
MDYFIGHLIGDYLLQNDWQAMNKKSWSLRGWAACLVHCLLYTLAVLLCTGWWRWDLIILVFMSHFPIDKTYVVAWYMMKVGSFKRIICSTGMLDPVMTGTLEQLVRDLDALRTLHKTWAYLFVDNTVHLTMLWLIARYAV